MLLLILFCQVLNCGYCQSNHLSSPKLSTQIKSTIQDPSSDSTLRAENQFYKLKEDYYSDALSDQASRFGSIVSAQSTVFSVVVGLLGAALGLGLFNFRRQLESQIATLRQDVQVISHNVEEKNKYALYRIYRSYSETMLSQAENNIATIGSHVKGLFQCLQSFETLALSYQYSQTDQYRVATDRYVRQAIDLANRAITNLDENIEESKKRDPEDEYSSFFYKVSDYRDEFLSLFDKQIINFHVVRLLREVNDEALTEAILALRDGIYRIARDTGAQIPDRKASS